MLNSMYCAFLNTKNKILSFFSIESGKTVQINKKPRNHKIY